MVDAEMQEPPSSPRVRPFNPHPLPDAVPYISTEQDLRFRDLISKVQLPFNNCQHSGSATTPGDEEAEFSLEDLSCSDSLDEVIQHWNLLQISSEHLRHNRRESETSCDHGESILNPEAHDDKPSLQPALEFSPDDFLSDFALARLMHLDRLRDGKVL